jgi:hypothetical protein
MIFNGLVKRKTSLTHLLGASKTFIVGKIRERLFSKTESKHTRIVQKDHGWRNVVPLVKKNMAVNSFSASRRNRLK